METSGLYRLDWHDLAKGLIVSVGGAVIAALQGYLQAGSLNFDWKTIGSTALAAGLAYLGKNFITPAQIITSAKPIKP